MIEETAITIPVDETGAGIIPSPCLDQVREYTRASKSDNTIRGYQSDWREICGWCEVRQVQPMPSGPETVAAFIVECAERLKMDSIQRRLNASQKRIKRLGLESSTHSGMVTDAMTAPAGLTGPRHTEDGIVLI